MKLMPIVYVTDMTRAVEFYRHLGGIPNEQSRSPSWTEMLMEGGSIGLHITKAIPRTAKLRVDLALVSAEPLGGVLARLSEGGVSIVRPVTDETFGSSIVVRDPDGLGIQVNYHEL